jgi:hypothetical protein
LFQHSLLNLNQKERKPQNRSCNFQQTPGILNTVHFRVLQKELEKMLWVAYMRIHTRTLLLCLYGSTVSKKFQRIFSNV